MKGSGAFGSNMGFVLGGCKRLLLSCECGEQQAGRGSQRRFWLASPMLARLCIFFCELMWD